ncbi:putative cysteine-rich receptor-like protein kinase 20 [Phalaenopsis equestris]|uniref:putative cysteine-rich receptor-like protein kinase 20 n=1 Tax=Phalaenopsis equestris TaxID=78828 RepID=UPI0009E2C4E7|nr:putative cysteine-rich receptor-like protein kinase 20 [Phalaenopsis equestris]
MSSPTSLAFLLLVLLSLFASPATAYLLYNVCGSTGNFSTYSTYSSNLNVLLSTLSSNASATGFATFTTGSIPDSVTGLILCRGDTDIFNCRSCIHTAIKEIRQFCPNQKDASIWYDLCLLRYSSQNFLYAPDITSNIKVFMFNTQTVSAEQLSPTNGSSTANTTRPTADSSHGGSSKVGTVVAITVPVVVAIVLISTISIWLCRRKPRRKQPGEANLEEFSKVETILFDLPTLKVATENFSELNKVGEGGFGSVYKGVLPDGQEIAVKRLSAGSGQGLEELKNELVVTALLHHKNIVRLYGVCLEKTEKLLIYEYAPNKSLDTILFDPTKSKLLDWMKRCEIIGGIARGLLYLHEDSQLKIIHRDLKASNILLDVDMNAKISDFGMARIFRGDESQGKTSNVVGTCGYMAPEYGLHGHFSDKSDVFSFGVLVLEILTGRSNKSFFNDDHSEDLLSYVWKNWKNGTVLEIVDPTLAKPLPRSEVMRCFQIGLLCAQHDFSQRPTMITVVVMLNSYSMSIEAPSAPAFFAGVSGINTEEFSRKFDIYENDTYKPSSKKMPM